MGKNMNAHTDFNNLPSTQNAIDFLVSEFDREANNINQAFELVAQLKTLDSNLNNFMSLDLSSINSPEISMIQLRQKYWFKLYEKAELKNILSYDAVNEFNATFTNVKSDGAKNLVDFTYDNALCTLESWLNNGEKFFIDRVDSVFTKLSHGHLTNHPNGFNRKMIFTYAVEQSVAKLDCGSIRYESRRKFQDLRAIIAIAHGLPNPDDHSNFFDSLSRVPYGRTIEIDDGLWALRVFKNGNIHVWVEPETAITLNWYLAKKYPNTLATRDVAKSKVRKHFSYFSESAPKDLLSGLDVLGSRGQLTKQQEVLLNKFTGLSLENCAGVNTQELKNTFNKIGVPDIKSYQFYPTPSAVTETIKDYIGNYVCSTDKFLEPSAGHGAIAGLYPANFTAYEIFAPFIDVLTAKGINAEKKDFLEVKGNREFDKVIMNPPYSFNRCMTHLEHAFSFIKPDGEILIVAPTGNKNKLEQICLKFRKSLHELKAFDGVFEDTNIKTSLFVIS